MSKSKQFLYELNDFSIQAVEILIGKGKTQSTKHSGTWPQGKPKGMTLHYTAGQQNRVESVLRYFIRHEAKVSSWCFILDGRHPKLEPIIKDYPSLDSLPASVIQFGNIENTYWHNGWCNKLHVGIDLRNAGILTKKENNFYDGYGNPYSGREPVKEGRYYWEPYTKQQIKTTAVVCDAVRAFYNLDEPERFLPHSGSKNTKYDTGLAFPIEAVRGYVYKIKPPIIGMMPEEFWETQCTMNKSDYYDLHQVDKETDEFYEKAWEEAFDEDIPTIEEGYNYENDTVKLKAYQYKLDRLGYHIPSPYSLELTPSLKITTQYFQKANGLTVDGIPGPQTYKAVDKIYFKWF